MIQTSSSLLARLQSGSEAEAWSRFVSLYTPLLFFWVRRQGVPAADAADLVQDVFTVLVTKLPAFHYDRQRRFSDWLRTVTANKCRDYFRRRTVRREQTGASAEAEVIDHVQELSEAEYRGELARRALAIMQAEFAANTWQACWDTVVSGKPADEVARRLGISVNAVYVARSRVLRRLREELAGLWE
jgi:RNA polymerase sigma-70 factor, ECF subfamily